MHTTVKFYQEILIESKVMACQTKKFKFCTQHVTKLPILSKYAFYVVLKSEPETNILY